MLCLCVPGVEVKAQQSHGVATCNVLEVGAGQYRENLSKHRVLYVRFSLSTEDLIVIDFHEE